MCQEFLLFIASLSSAEGQGEEEKKQLLAMSVSP
jgi:hypothetical protein